MSIRRYIKQTIISKTVQVYMLIGLSLVPAILNSHPNYKVQNKEDVEYSNKIPVLDHHDEATDNNRRNGRRFLIRRRSTFKVPLFNKRVSFRRAKINRRGK